MFLLNGKKININRDLTIGEGKEAITYPAASLQNAALREQIGIVEMPDPIRPDDRYYFVIENEDGTFTTELKPLEPIRRQKLDEINQHTESLISAVRAEYPSDEVLSWPKQETEARAFTADNKSSVPLISAIAEYRGVPLGILAEKVIIKSDAYAQYTGAIIGIRQALEDQLMAIDLTALDALERVLAVEWPVEG